MKTNMGSADKVIRIAVAAIVALLFFAGVISGMLAIVLLAVAGILLVTAIIGFCPLYYPLGINTGKTNKAA